MTTLYTLAEVAEQTGFALRSLQRDARAGKIAHIHRGRQRLMTEEQIQALLQQGTVTPAASANPSAEKDMARLRKMMSRDAVKTRR